MKKTLATLALLGSVSATAAELPTQPANPQNSPKMSLEIYDVGGKTPRQIEGRKYSISKKNLRLCWVVFDMAIEPQNQVVEIFKSPKAGNFSAPDSEVSTSKDKKTHTIKSTIPSYSIDENVWLERCWSLDKKDPLGRYTLELRVNDVIFPAQSFQVVK